MTLIGQGILIECVFVYLIQPFSFVWHFCQCFKQLMYNVTLCWIWVYLFKLLHSFVNVYVFSGRTFHTKLWKLQMAMLGLKLKEKYIHRARSEPLFWQKWRKLLVTMNLCFISVSFACCHGTWHDSVVSHEVLPIPYGPIQQRNTSISFPSQ